MSANPETTSADTPASDERGRQTGYRRSVVVLIFAMMLLVFCVISVRRSGVLAGDDRFIVDDSFMFLRYVDNCIDGYGLVWNVDRWARWAPPLDGLRIEGYTSVGHLLWLLAIRLVRVPPLQALFLSSFLPAVGLLIASFVLLLRALPRGQSVFALFAPAFWFLNPRFHVHARSGMETLAFALLLLAACWLLFRLEVEAESRSGRERRAPGLISALSLVLLFCGAFRPEAVLFAALCIGVVLKRGYAPVRTTLIVVGTRLALPGLVYFLWRWHYYGMLFPLPFYLKGAALPILYTPGLMLSQHVGFLGMLALPLGLGLIGVTSDGVPRATRRAFVLVAAVLLVYSLYYLNVTLIMGFDYRFLFPIAMPLVVLSGVAFGQWLATRNARPRAARLCVLGLLVLAAISDASHLSAKLDQLFYDHRWYTRVGKALGDCGLSPDTIIGSNESGKLPYYSGLRTVDMSGLNNPHIARHPKDWSYVFSCRPAIIFNADYWQGRPADLTAHGYRVFDIMGKTVWFDKRFLQACEARNGVSLVERLKGLCGEERGPHGG